MDTKKQFGEWLTQQYLAWQKAEGERKSVSDLAVYLGIAQSSASKYLSGQALPDGNNALRIAMRFGLGVYSVIGLEPPFSKSLMELAVIWEQLTEESRQAVKDRALKERGATKYETKNKTG